MSHDPDIGPLLPQSPDAEMGVIGSFMLAPREVGEMCAERRIVPEMFHVPAHAMIYRELFEMWEDELAIDVVTLTQRLRDKGLLEACGGPALVTQLFTLLPTVANAVRYMEILAEKFTLREVIRIGTSHTARAYSDQDMVKEIVESLTSEVLDVGSTRRAENQCVTASAVTSALALCDERLLDMDDGIPTGIPQWDDNLGPLRKGRMIVLGARPKVGKTALIETMMANQVAKGHRVICFQRDMPIGDMIARIACRKADAVYEDYERGTLPDQAMARVRAALANMPDSKWRFYCPAKLTPSVIRRTIQSELRKGPVAAVYLDVFQRVTGGDDRHGMTESLTEASKVLRDITLSTGVPMIIAAHMNREADKTGGRPHSGQFKYCDQLFSDCDIAVLLWSDEDPKELCDTFGRWRRQHVIMTVDANRGGYVGDESLYFDRPKMRFHVARSG